MNTNNKTGIIGVISVFALLILHSISHWSTIDTVMSWLVSKGPVGVAGRDFLLSPLVPLVIAIAALGLFWSGRRDKAKEQGKVLSTPPEEARTKAEVKVVEPTAKAEAIVRDSGNSSARIGDINIYPPIPHTPIQPIPPPKAKEKHIELTALAIINKWIVLEDTAELWHFGSGRNVVSALLLPFYFDPIASDPVYSIEYVRAHLIFTTTTGHKIRVDHGCWIDSSVDCINIHPGETRHLIIAMAAEGEYAAINTNRTNHDFHVDKEAFDLISLGTHFGKLEVVLIWAGGGQFKRVYNLDLDLSQLSKLLPS